MNNKKVLSLLVPFLAMSFVVIGLWIPFGFKTTGLIEEWSILGLLNEGYQLFFVTPDSALGAHALRPFTVLPHVIAYTLDPNSFLWFNIQQIIFFIGKGFFAYLILKRMLPNHYTFAFMVAVLFIVHPSDTGLFTFRAIHIHGSVMFYMIAAYFLLAYYQDRRWWMLVVMWIVLATSLFMYEVTYPIVAFTPIVLIWTARRINRQVIWVSFLWYLAPLITGIYSVFVFQQMGSDGLYQTASRGIAPLSDILLALGKAYSRSFVTGWAEVQLQSPYLLSALILSGLVCAVSLYLMQSTATPISTKRSAILFVIGLGVIFLGFVFYLIYSSHLFQTLRTYYVSSLGAALAIGIFVYLIAGRKQIIFVAVMSVLIGLSFINGFNQHRYYQDLSLRQQRFLGQIVEQLPVIEGKQTIFIRENTNLLDTEWFFQWNPALTSTLQYIYKNPNLKAIICYMAVGKTYASPLELIPCPSSEGMIIFDYSFANELQLISNIHNDIVISPTVFSCWPIDDCTTSIGDLIPTAPTMIDADQIYGYGWRGFETDQTGTTFQWANSKESTLNVRIPDELAYKVSFLIYHAGDDQDGLDLSVNGQSIDLVISSTGVFYEGIIPAGVANQSIDVLRFTSDEITDYGLYQFSFSMDWVKLEPLTRIDKTQIDFDTLISGTGWRGTETSSDGTTFQWSNIETASIDLGFLAQGNYQISVKPFLILPPNTFEDIELWVGEIRLDADFNAQTNLITALLPQSLVETDRLSELLIKVPQLVTVETSELGVALDWVKVEPFTFLDNVHIDFDTTLSGTGWRGAETSNDGTTFQWSNIETASVNLGFLEQKTYQINIKPFMVLAPNTFEDIELWVGTTRLDADFNAQTNLMTAILPQSLVEMESVSKLLIKMPQLVAVETSELGVALDWVKVEPLTFLDNIHIDFDATLLGMGWRGAETSSDDITFQWSIAEVAEVDLGFLAQKDYQISLKPFLILSPNTFEDVELWVGTTRLDTEFNAETQIMTAILPQSLVETERVSKLLVKVPQLVAVEISELGVALDWLKVEPISNG